MQQREKDQTRTRDRTIIRYNLAGILVNLLLSVMKLIVGLMIDSRAVVLDAVNGLSDILSSGVSMISTLYASRRTDREHPFGYGRLEYVTSLLTTVFVLTMGLIAVYDAVRELLSAEGRAPEYNTVTVVLMCVSLAAKLIYGLLSRRTGKRINSVALVMIGTETLGDAVVSLSILIAIAVYRFTGFDIEPWLSVLISLFIIKTGLTMIGECMRKLLGRKGEPEQYRALKRMIAEEPEVQNVFNLVIHNYGEERSVGSVDITVDEEMKTVDTTRLMRRIIRRADEQGVTLTSVGIYGVDIDPESDEIRDRILQVIRAHPEFRRACAFNYDAEEKTCFFNVLLDPAVRDRRAYVAKLQEELTDRFPGMRFDIDVSQDE